MAATPLVLCEPTIAILAMRTFRCGPSSIRLTLLNAGLIIWKPKANFSQKPAVNLGNMISKWRGSSIP